MAYRYEPVAKEDTYKLIEAAQKGDRRARELIVEQNIGLVKNLAMKYASGYYEPEDLMQVGFVGLVKAIDRFDTAFDVMFSTGDSEERSGMGFTVMESFMDRLKVKSEKGKGTAVIMTKYLDIVSGI